MLFASALWIASCAPDPDTRLKPPAVHVYKQPQVWVTHAAPMPVATEIAEAEATQTMEPDGLQPFAGPTFDEQQFLLDDIDFLFNEIETKLNNTDVNP